ncbi:uncharacterized protein LOC113857995 isoform X2 [Abrus precatorius]|uniref:Uncharacterized protein LOC113857995 isoform X2 n=1 Tax=Abrus precatorius TaxID=3816 RepID=A0A8B8KQQ2_ABRPR|nr:uncharacterized protein LOC113857995 isoform X2 [Abrus precatorius]
MRVKSLCKRRSVPSASGPSFSAIPLLSDQRIATVYDTENDDDDCIKSEAEAEPEPRPEPVDLLDRSICICCDDRGKEEEVLVCSEKDCPVAVHASCIGSEPKFDASGNFYCPYCWYKRAVDTCQQLREKAMVAKKALSTFLETRADSNATRGRENVNPVQDGPYVSETESEEDEGEVSVTSTGSSVSETGDSESEGISVKKRKVGSVRKSLLPSSRGKLARDVNAEVQDSKSLRKPLRSPLQGMKQASLTAKRRRLRWTDEEEKVLKEGVLKFSMENQNIPWRKILEFGCHVFHKTRTPADLKDKWKNITSKEGCK